MNKSITESDSTHEDLENKSAGEILRIINEEDKKVALAVEKSIQQIEQLSEQIILRMKKGGRLFYIGAGTSGRLGILDASECPPTYGVPHGWVIGLIAGGDAAIRKAVEFAEDDLEQAWKDISKYSPTVNDIVIGIAASGRTPYVIGGIREARKKGLLTGCITNNPQSILAAESEHPIEVIVGPEVVTGSTRMKSGTAQKLVLNMISTTTMIGLGRVKGNKMVDMQLANKKLVQRGELMLMEQLRITREEAAILLERHGSVRNAIQAVSKV